MNRIYEIVFASAARYVELEVRGKVGLSKAGWVARTRLLAEPLSPRGPQPVQ